jgi:hypothetical protein
VAKHYTSRQELLANCPPVSLWPTVQVSLIPENDQELFNHRCDAVTKYIDGYAISEIEETTGISQKLISSLVKRCLIYSSDGRILGFRALIPFINLKKYERKAQVNHKYPDAQGGLSGVFCNTLNKFPEIEKKLIQYIKKKNSPELNVHEKKIRAKDLHRLFIKLLKAKGVQDTEWPFNTKHLGFKTIQNYLDEVLDESLGRTVNTREEQVASAHLAVGTGHQRFLSFEEPYDVVQLDAYSINAFFTSEFETPEGTSVDIQLERIWHIAMIEPVSGAILAYKTVYRSEVSADDVMDVIRRAVNPPIKPEISIPGLLYPENGGLPNEIFPQCQGAVWGAIMLDGALAHLSNAVHDRARKQLGFIINWGPVAHFERRPDIERYFANLSKDVFMRLPSTTGANPHNGRAKNAEEKAVIYKIRADEVEQLIAVITAQHNITPHQGTSFNSPIEVLKYYLERNSDHFILRKIPVKTGSTSILIPFVRACIVRGGRASGRRPYIQFLGERYSNPILAAAPALIGKTLTIEINDNDGTYCKAYLPEGGELGILKAMGNWGKSKHSLRTRKIINSLITKKILVVSSQQDPVQVYLDYLSTKNKTKKKSVISPSAATEATRVAKESGLPKKIKNQDIKQHNQLPKLGDLYEKRPALLNKPIPDLNKLLKS